jgi:hypothetical protein
MDLVRRLFGGGRSEGEEAAGEQGAGGPGQDAGGGNGADAGGDASTADPTMDEAARDRELQRAEAARLNDEFLQRQMRYADRSWTPPAQGGTRRSGDEEGEAGDG